MTEASTIAILQAIDQQLLTVEDLAYYVKLPLDQVEAIVQQLWDAGYVQVVQRRFSVTTLAVFSQPQHSRVDRSMSFNLTPKGHFRLHPIRQTPRRRGE